MTAPRNYIDQLLATFQQAAAANRATAGRRGNVVHLDNTDATEVMITTDLHGHRHNYNRIICIADLERHPRRHLVMQEVCHGGPTYPGNGGCMSHLLLEDVAALKVRYPDRVHFILSNHELAELTDYPIVKKRQMQNLAFRFGLQAMYGEATEEVRQAYLPFLKTCPLAIRVPEGVFISHTVPDSVDARGFDASLFERETNDDDLAERSALFSLVWGRDFRQQNADAFAELVDARVMIHGHEPCRGGYAAPNSRQVILDCCGPRACYLMLPVGQRLTQKEIVQRIQRLH